MAIFKDKLNFEITYHLYDRRFVLATFNLKPGETKRIKIGEKSVQFKHAGSSQYYLQDSNGAELLVMANKLTRITVDERLIDINSRIAPLVSNKFLTEILLPISVGCLGVVFAVKAGLFSPSSLNNSSAESTAKVTNRLPAESMFELEKRRQEAKVEKLAADKIKKEEADRVAEALELKKAEMTRLAERRRLKIARKKATQKAKAAKRALAEKKRIAKLKEQKAEEKRMAALEEKRMRKKYAKEEKLRKIAEKKLEAKKALKLAEIEALDKKMKKEKVALQAIIQKKAAEKSALEEVQSFAASQTQATNTKKSIPRNSRNVTSLPSRKVSQQEKNALDSRGKIRAEVLGSSRYPIQRLGASSPKNRNRAKESESREHAENTMKMLIRTGGRL